MSGVVGMLVLVVSTLWGSLAFAADVTVTPGSGPGGMLVTATSSGFDAELVGYNTGFYVTSDDVHYQFLGACPGPPGTDGWANCSIQIRMPGPTGQYTVAAFNSNSEFASTSYEALRPSLVISPSCGPNGTPSIVVTGQAWAIEYDAGIYLDGSLVRAGNYPSSDGGFSQTVLGSSTAGVHTVRVFNSAGQDESTTFTMPLGAQPEEVHIIPLPRFCVGIDGWSQDFSDGQRLEVTCDGFLPAYRLWHTSPSGERGTIAQCIFGGGINIGKYWSTPDRDCDGKPDHLIRTGWINIDGGLNDGQSHALEKLNPTEHEPYLDVITYVYEAATNKYGWTNEKYNYPPDPTGVAFVGPEQIWNYLKTQDPVPGIGNSVDPPVDAESQQFFDLLQQSFAELPLEPMSSVSVCDLDADGHCDDVDVALFEASMGSCRLQPGFLGAADIDGDGCVTQVDKAAWTEYHDHYRSSIAQVPVLASRYVFALGIALVGVSLVSLSRGRASS